MPNFPTFIKQKILTTLLGNSRDSIVCIKAELHQ